MGARTTDQSKSRQAVIKKEIASVEGDKSLRPDDKQVQLEPLRAELKSPPESVKIPAP
jgi:hypothetical protein